MFAYMNGVRPVLSQNYVGTILRYYFLAGAEIVLRNDLTGWAKILVKNLTLKVLDRYSLFIAFLDRSHCPAHSHSIFFGFLQFLTDLRSFGIIQNMG
jgi:hypothetical protein